MLSPIPRTGVWVGGVRLTATAVLQSWSCVGLMLPPCPPLFAACCGGADQQRAIDGVLSTFQASVIFVDSV